MIYDEVSVLRGTISDKVVITFPGILLLYYFLNGSWLTPNMGVILDLNSKPCSFT